jgi:hypothetical protein
MKRQQFRHAGVLKWKMGEIIVALPLLLCCLVMFSFGGPISWVWVINQIVGAVIRRLVLPIGSMNIGYYMTDSDRSDYITGVNSVV